MMKTNDSVKYTAGKAHAAGAGSAVAGALSTLLAPAFWGEPVPLEKAIALSTVLGFLLAWVAAYIAPANEPKSPRRPIRAPTK